MKKIAALFVVLSVFSVFSYSAGFEEDVKAAGEKAVISGNDLPQPSVGAGYEQGRAEMENFFNYLDNSFKTSEPAGTPSLFSRGGASVPLYSIDLSKIKNEYLRSPITFKTSKGTTVYVSGSKSSNCPDLSNKCADKEKFFMILTAGNQTFFIRAMEIINWSVFMSGSKTVTIDGEKYTAKVYANASSPEKSKLEIKGPSGTVINSSLDKLGEALAVKGVDLKLSKTYKLAYGNEVVQTGGGNAKFTNNTLLLFIPYPVRDASSYFIIKSGDIKASGTTFPEMESGYSFKLSNSVVEISKL